MHESMLSDCTLPRKSVVRSTSSSDSSMITSSSLRSASASVMLCLLAIASTYCLRSSIASTSCACSTRSCATTHEPISASPWMPPPPPELLADDAESFALPCLLPFSRLPAAACLLEAWLAPAWLAPPFGVCPLLVWPPCSLLDRLGVAWRLPWRPALPPLEPPPLSLCFLRMITNSLKSTRPS